MYVARRNVKVQLEDGTIVTRKPGQLVPEAANWAKPEIWVRRGFIKPIDDSVDTSYDRSKLKSSRESTEADVKRAKSMVPKSGVPLDDAEEKKEDQHEVSKSELMSLTRTQLDSLAEEYKIDDPGSLPNKDAVATAILAEAEAQAT